MRILHTSDWHVGKTLRGESRLDEHRTVLGEISALARDRRIDIALVTGDLFESSAPPADAKALVWSTLLELRDAGAHVVVIAGNHDHAREFAAVAPVFGALGISVGAHVAAPDRGGRLHITTNAGERARVALVPFVSQRFAVRAEQLLALDSAQAVDRYAERVRRIVEALTADFAPDAVNVVAAHLMVRGGMMGGGERDAQTVHEYSVPTSVFPAAASYTALGHLHRTQELAAACPTWYAGSPIQVDFGEEQDTKHILLIEAEAGFPARVQPVPLVTPRRLRTVTGTLAELRDIATEPPDGALRVVVEELRRVGLADEVRELLPGAVDVRIQPPGHEGSTGSLAPRAPRTGRSAVELFADFCESRAVADARLESLFTRLLDEVQHGDNGAVDAGAG